MINEIKIAVKNHKFVGIVCEDGHEHTVKAFDNVCGTPFFDSEDELENQLIYCEKISNGFDVEILIADTLDEAIEKDIIFDNEDGTFSIK